MNEKLLQSDNKVIKRIFNLDTNAFDDGHISKNLKELVGLSCSLVLRCDDCVKYHLGKCHELGFTKAEIMEILSIGALIGGTITIPHLRKAAEYWEELDSE